MIGTTVTNVVARNTAAFEAAIKAAVEKAEGEDGRREDPATVVSSGNAGGLIGAMSSNTNVTKSAATLIVKGQNAGGLIGSSGGGSITACYSGGHTINSDISDAVIYSSTDYNVTASGTNSVAGGLIGDAGTTTISYCYSTCSATGATAGGLVGSATGSISNSYATGRVQSTAETPVAGAFAGTYSPESGKECSDCRYFEVINEQEDGSAGYTYLGAVGGGTYTGKIGALDETAAAFNDAFSPTDWQDAVPYNTTLPIYYNNQYNLETVKQLGATIEDTDFVSTHYGDWPAPEIFVFNTKASGS